MCSYILISPCLMVYDPFVQNIYIKISFQNHANFGFVSLWFQNKKKCLCVIYIWQFWSKHSMQQKLGIIFIQSYPKTMDTDINIPTIVVVDQQFYWPFSSVFKLFCFWFLKLLAIFCFIVLAFVLYQFFGSAMVKSGDEGHNSTTVMPFPSTTVVINCTNSTIASTTMSTIPNTTGDVWNPIWYSFS